MDELIGRLVSDVGVDKAAAEMAVGIFSISFRKKDLPTKCNCSWRSSPEPKP
jgi:hypothetical protein